VVLEILPLDLSIVLKKVAHRSHINATDNLLRTPLSWAAIRGNFDAVQTLLLAGADPHTTDIEGYSALHLAVISGNLRCLDLLLIDGAQVHAKAKGGDNCVSIASWATDSPEMIEMLVIAGADFMNRNKGGVTPLQSSACLNFPGNAKALLNLGADVNAFDNNGDTPFFETMYYGCMEVMDILLKQNVDHSHRNKAGLSALHVLALYGNVDIFNRVSSSLTIIDTRLRDSKGRTAIEALEDRPLLEEEFHLAFQNYWRELELTADEQSEDSFASALETQPPTEMSEIV
jgi:ankyrin repeat protein